MVAFENTLFQLILLIGALNAKPRNQRVTPLIITAGILLAFIPPAIPLAVPWELLLSLTLPLLLWQNVRRVFNARWLGSWKEIALWAATAILVGALLRGLSSLGWTWSLCFGVLTASMVWRAGETDEMPTLLSQIGPISLIFLMLEVEPIGKAPNQMLGDFFSGAGFGVVIALFASHLTLKVFGKFRNLIALGQAYGAYAVALMLDTSAIAACLASVVVYFALGIYREFWTDEWAQPAPLNSWIGFSSILVVFLFLGWQAHQRIAPTIVLEAILGSMLSITAVWVGRKLSLPAFGHDTTIWRAGLTIAVLLLAALLMWPRGVALEGDLFVYALIMSILILAMSRIPAEYLVKER